MWSNLNVPLEFLALLHPDLPSQQPVSDADGGCGRLEGALIHHHDFSTPLCTETQRSVRATVFVGQ